MGESVTSQQAIETPQTSCSHHSGEAIIDVHDVSMIFNIASEQFNSLKEYFLALTRGELKFKEFRALNHINFQVKRGESFGLVGTNGSGKSTMLKIIAGVLEASEGTCTVTGSIAPLIELGAGFDMELTAKENIYLNGALLGYRKDFIDEHFDEIVAFAGGDGRAALTSLELASQMALAPGEVASKDNKVRITSEHVLEANPRRGLPYDKSGDMHYDIISAFIKSMRGSDPDAALYWLARMIDAGEDPKFIARRIFILASEDIGNADPEALLIAEAAFRSAEVIGYPECRINLAQAALYMALAPKSNAAEAGIDAALAEVRKGPRREVPNHLRDRHRPGSDAYGSYLYPHDFEGGWVSQQYLPDGLQRGAFFHPSPRGWEAWRIDSVFRDRADDTSNRGNASDNSTNG